MERGNATSSISEKEISRKPMRVLFAGFCLSVVILASFSIISFVQIRKERIVSDWIVHSFNVKLKMRESMSHLIHAQSQQRAFLLTRDSSFYKSYGNSVQLQMEVNKELDSLTRGYEVQFGNLRRFELLSKRRSRHLQKVIEAAKHQSIESLTPMLMTGARIMDSLNVQIQKMEKAEDEHLKFRLAQKDRRERTISEWILGFSIIALVTIVISFLILRTQRFRLSRAEINKLYLEKQIKERTREIRHANRELQNRNIELNARNVELENFTFVSSHDMQEPLRKIKTFLKLILDTDGNKLSDKSKKYANGILSSAERMNKLIAAILVYMQATRHKKKEMVDLNRVAHNILKEQKKFIDRTSAIVNFSDLPTIPGVRSQLEGLFCTFVSNSIKFCKRRPNIKVSCISDNYNGHDVWRIDFSDNGIGFDMAYSKKIFQIFQKLHSKDEYPGTGLGLALAKRIVENHGGIISVTSQEGKGSTFTVYIPKQEGITLRHN